MIGKKMWITKAMKDWEDGHDLDAKNRIANLIRKNNIHHFPLFDETIFINKNNFSWTRQHPTGFNTKEELSRQWAVFMPDMLYYTKNLIIEIDGDFHRNTQKGIKQTKRRNQYYEYAGIRLITLIPNEIKKMSDEELITLLMNV